MWAWIVQPFWGPMAESGIGALRCCSNVCWCKREPSYAFSIVRPPHLGAVLCSGAVHSHGLAGAGGAVQQQAAGPPDTQHLPLVTVHQRPACAPSRRQLCARLCSVCGPLSYGLHASHLSTRTEPGGLRTCCSLVVARAGEPEKSGAHGRLAVRHLQLAPCPQVMRQMTAARLSCPDRGRQEEKSLFACVDVADLCPLCLCGSAQSTQWPAHTQWMVSGHPTWLPFAAIFPIDRDRTVELLCMQEIQRKGVGRRGLRGLRASRGPLPGILVLIKPWLYRCGP